jgi:hypothetical protein
VLRISRTDAAETILLTLLLNSESDLHEYGSEPIVFPVYGRGRAFLSLVGKGINEETIMRMAGFLTGPCACEIKMENPGTDLLIAAQWMAAIANMPVAEPEPPPKLTSVFPEDLPPTGGNAPLSTTETAAVSVGGSGDTDASAPRDQPVGTSNELSMGHVAIASIAAILAAVAVVSIIIGRQKAEE